MDELAQRRKEMVQALMAEGYLISKSVYDAMLKVERHKFIPSSLEPDAYADHPLQIGMGQTISAPHMVAIMCEKLSLSKGQRVLEIGSGSGYHAAVVAELVGDGKEGRVYTVERITELAEYARKNLDAAGYSRTVEVIAGDGTKGLAEHSPYDRIYVTAASPGVPGPLVAQLKDGGKLLVPVGSRYYQDLLLVQKHGGETVTENHGGCVFVPLIGEHGHNG